MGALRILAVDDNPADLRLLKEYLGQDPATPFEVVGAATLGEALGILTAGGFDAVLLDLNLPDCTGLSGLDRITASAPGLPVIVLTGLQDAATGLLALSRNAQDYLVKGNIDGDVLTRSVRYAIERKRAVEAVRRMNAELERRAAEVLSAGEALRVSRRAALNLMDDALAARRQAEQALEALRESREDLNRAQAVAHQGSWRLDVRRNELVWSDENWRIFGVPKGTPLTYETFLGVVHPDDRAYVNEKWTAALRGEPYDIEHRIVMGETVKWVRERAELEVDAQGVLRGGFGTTQDVTDIKNAEQALIRAKDEWERTFDSVPDLIAILDERHRVVRANRAMALKLGRTPEECVGAPCLDVVHGCDGPPGDCPHARTLTDGKEHTAEVHEDRLGGDYLVTTTPLRDSSGRMIGAVHVARDITERKLREQQLQRLNRALSALGHSGQALIRATDEAEFLADACRIVAQDCGYAMVWIGFAENDEARSIRPAARAGFEDGYLDTLKLTWADTERGRGPTGTAIRTGRVCRCPDMLTDPHFLPWREDAIKRGYASSIALPLMAGGKTFGALTIYAREPVGFAEDEVHLLTDLAADFAQGIASLRAQAAQARAERAVRESEERYRTLFSTMTEGFALHEIVCDRDGAPCDYRFLDINPAFERLTGLKRDDVIGRTVLEMMPQTEPVWIERYGRVALTGVPDQFEHVSAELGRHYEVTAYRTAPGRFAVIFNDVTELKAMQRRETEDAIRLAWGQSAVDTINAMREGVMLMEMDGSITSVNPAMARMIGLAAGAIVGRNVASLLPEFLKGSDLRMALRGMSALRRGGLPELPPLLLRRADGETLHVLPSLSRLDAPEGGLRLAVLTLKDVTELHEAAHRLEQSERKYRELVQNANSIIIRITPDHRITFFNEYAQEFFGYREEEVLGRSVLGTILPEVDSEGGDIAAMMRGITEHTELYSSNENENVRSDGSRVWVHWANRAVRDREGRVVEILCVGTDVTRRREMAAQARRYQQRLRELTERLAVAEEQDRWRISRYIHDTIIQNLSLSSIRLGSMARRLTDADLHEAASGLNQTREVIDQAIDECRMVMSDLTPSLLYELGLTPALRDLAQQLEAKHGARVEIEDDGREKPMSHPLRGLVFESARELIMNALKHAGPCKIRVAASLRDRDLIVRVTDSGAGFDPEKLDGPREHAGGFGLFNIRQRLEGLGGRLEIASVLGQGTTATLVVPLDEGERT